MNHEKEYSKTPAAACEVRRVKALSSEGHFLPESALKELSKAPHQLMIVADRGEKSAIKAVQVAVGKAGRRYVADKITGTLYDPETGRSMSGARMLEGPAPDGYEPPQRESYNFGTQPITNSPKAVPKKRRKPLKEGVERNAAGKVCGSSKHGAKVDEDAVRAIRAHKPGTTNIFVMTAKQAAARYGIHEKTVSDIRRRRSWGHVE